MNKDSTTTALACLGAIALLIVYPPIAWLVNGWAASTLWGWFVTPVFESAPTLTTWTAVGLAIVVNVFVKQIESAQAVRDPERTKTSWLIMYTLTTPLWFCPAGGGSTRWVAPGGTARLPAM